MILNTVHHACRLWLVLMDDAQAAAIGAQIKQLRKGSRMSQEELASRMRESEQTHWHQNTVSRVEAGKQRVNLAEIHALNAILGGNVIEGFDQQGLSSLNVSYVNLIDSQLSFLTGSLEGIQERLRYLRQATAELRYLSGERNWGDGLEVVSMVTTDEGRHWKYSDGTERVSARSGQNGEGHNGERPEAP